MTKVGYADSLKQLEKISEEIHERRKVSNRIDNEGEKIDKDKIKSSLLGTRQDGVGAEFPSPCSAGKLFTKQLSTNNAVASETQLHLALRCVVIMTMFCVIGLVMLWGPSLTVTQEPTV